MSREDRKIDDDQGRIISWAKLMMGRKVQIQLSPAYALHSTFDLVTGYPAYRGKEYEHLQSCTISPGLPVNRNTVSAKMMLKSMNEFFLLLFQGIHSTDEVNFIQNLVFYVERAYRTPDSGMWERGNITMEAQRFMPVGIARAALRQSMNVTYLVSMEPPGLGFLLILMPTTGTEQSYPGNRTLSTVRLSDLLASFYIAQKTETATQSALNSQEYSKLPGPFIC
nr:phosphorylase b kinase regulatory subunit beta-like [Biomphalaria glabrata]